MENQTRKPTRRVGRALKRSGSTKQRKGGAGFGARYKPPKAGERLTPLLLFRGLYKVKLKQPDGSYRIDELDYDIKCEHFSKAANRGTVCTAGLVEDTDGYISAGDDPCVPCHVNREEGKGPIGLPRKIHVLNGILLTDFHIVDSDREKLDSNGRGTGEYYPEYIECLGKRCTHCKRKVETTFGRAVYMPLGNNFIQQLADLDLITLAGECRCGGVLEPVGFTCPNCGMPFADLEQDEVTEEELQALRDQEFRCKHCNQTDYMDEVPVCNQCEDPRPLTMWNTVMELYRSGDGVNTSLQVKKYRPVTEEELKQVKDLMVPADTDRLFKPLKPAAQAERLKIKLPAGFKGNGESTKPRGATRWDD